MKAQRVYRCGCGYEMRGAMKSCPRCRQPLKWVRGRASWLGKLILVTAMFAVLALYFWILADRMPLAR